MKIDKGTSVAVVINRHWANLQGVRMFLRPEKDIGGADESHVVFATMLDSEDRNGLWIEVTKRKEDSTVKRFSFLIPWSQILSVVVGEDDFSPDIRDQARKIGFG
jgi:hypothetical protein